MSTTKTPRAKLTVESLEDRMVLSLSSASMTGTTLVAFCNDNASNVSITRSGSTTTINDTTNGFSRSFSGVDKVQVVGGASADRIVMNVSTMRLEAWGKGGNDYLEGWNAADSLVGGDGADTLVGYGGDDMMWGEAGNDVLRGMDGNDQLIGGDGDDRLNGGAGADKFWGGNGDDVMIALDNASTDTVQGDAGRDIIWIDSSDAVAGQESADKVYRIGSFANGADKTLDGDRIADPTALSGHTYKRFSGNQLFSSSGPRSTDVRQGSVGDCWLVAGLSAIAMDNNFALRQNIVDFDDGTYGVALGGKFYRVDDDLAVTNSGSTTPVYAKLGAENSMWVAIAEKAYAHYRTGANTFRSIEGGWSVEVNRAFGSTSAGAKGIRSYANANDMATDMYNRWNTYQAVTIGILNVGSGVQIIGGHMYTVWSFTRNSAGQVTAITLRNPWGYDGIGNDGNTSDGLLTFTPAQLYSCTGDVNWGRV